LLRDIRSQPSGGNCNALFKKKKKKIYIYINSHANMLLTASPSVPDKAKKREIGWSFCSWHANAPTSSLGKKCFSCANEMKMQHW